MNRIIKKYISMLVLSAFAFALVGLTINIQSKGKQLSIINWEKSYIVDQHVKHNFLGNTASFLPEEFSESEYQISPKKAPSNSSDYKEVTSLKLPNFFSDHMVLQRNQPVNIWGWSAAGTKIEVKLGNIIKTTTAEKSGKWNVQFPEFKAGGPYTLNVSNKKEQITLKNILFGDVWFCSGQSNMGWKLINSTDAVIELKKGVRPEIRLLSVDRTMKNSPSEDIQTSGWQICERKTIKNFSAVAYFFGSFLYEDLNIPIGLIHSSWGGTQIETWMSKEAIQNFKDYNSCVQKMDTLDIPLLEKTGKATYEKWIGVIDSFDIGIKEKWNDLNSNKSEWKKLKSLTYWHNMPIERTDGVIWYCKQLDLNQLDLSDSIKLSLGNIDDEDVTYINGKLLNSVKNKDLERCYSIPLSYLKTGTNEITIRVKNLGGYGGFRSAKEKLYLQTANRKINLANNWQYALGTSYDLPKRPHTLHPNDYPSLLYNGMVAPFCQMPIKGIVWYQGESNAKKAERYSELFSAMINQWRKSWNNNNLPFLYVQLANYEVPADTTNVFARLREEQRKVSKMDNTAMIVTIDIGESDNVHARNKKEVGRRLALAAMQMVYNKNVIYSGPSFLKMEKKNGEITIFLDHAEGLQTINISKSVTGFKIAGEDGIYFDAEAFLKQNTVRVLSTKVPNPVSIKYAFENNPKNLNLINKEKLPAVPFIATLKNKKN